MCSEVEGENAVGYPDNNPKTVFGMTKPSVSKVPPSALFAIAEGLKAFSGLDFSDIPSAAILYMSVCMMDGAKKYGPYNWREKSVTASIYVDATIRHILAYQDGELNATDSGRPHLGHALASLAILIDAREYGNLIDDRPPSPETVLTQPFSRFEFLLKKRDHALTLKESECIHAVIGNLILWWDTKTHENNLRYLIAAITSLAILVDIIEKGEAANELRTKKCVASRLIAQWTEKPVQPTEAAA